MEVSAGTALIAALSSDIDRLLAAEPEVRSDADDSVHQMRVATRRLRSVLRSYRMLLQRDRAAEISAELKWLAGLLGVARDAEVRADRFEKLMSKHLDAATEVAEIDTVTGKPVDASGDAPREAKSDGAATSAAAPQDAAPSDARPGDAAPNGGTANGDATRDATPGDAATSDALPGDCAPGGGVTAGETRVNAPIATADDVDKTTARLVTAERARYDGAHAQILAALDSDRYLALRNTLSRWKSEPPLRPSRAAVPAPDFFRVVLQRDHERIEAFIRAEPSTAPADRIEMLHDIRKSAKRLRYSCEAAADILGEEATDLGKHAKHLQSVLGDHRDAIESHEAIVARAAEAEAAGENPALYHLLASAEDEAAHDELENYPAAAEALTTHAPQPAP
ncbi:CHAD domain-containing protein [Nocardia sp. XZ_19_385]|uniref:CHAD domain-containing protein n=1 Tax=Nocardia sp. XZ_19_385 TaxID=2769488 RepID=UPI00188FB08D|nr:CHAD domain-containing protein [Nocardia sp. XZ_19_385]